MHTLKWKRVLVFTKLKKFCNKPQKVLFPQRRALEHGIIVPCGPGQNSALILLLEDFLVSFRGTT